MFERLLFYAMHKLKNTNLTFLSARLNCMANTDKQQFNMLVHVFNILETVILNSN